MLAAYVRTNRARYTDEALRDAARAAGHSDAEIAAARSEDHARWEYLQQWRTPTGEIIPDTPGNARPIPMGYADGWATCSWTPGRSTSSGSNDVASTSGRRTVRRTRSGPSCARQLFGGLRRTTSAGMVPARELVSLDDVRARRGAVVPS